MIHFLLGTVLATVLCACFRDWRSAGLKADNDELRRQLDEAWIAVQSVHEGSEVDAERLLDDLRTILADRDKLAAERAQWRWAYETTSQEQKARFAGANRVNLN